MTDDARTAHLADLEAAYLDEVCDGDGAFEATLLAAFARSAAELLPRLERAVAEGDTPEAGEVAHRLKGAARSIGAPALAAALETLERVADTGDQEALPALLKPVREGHARLRLALAERHPRLRV